MAEDNRQEQQDFPFVKEKIKRQPFYQNKTFKKVAFQVILAVCCGAIACFTFVMLYPWMQKTFGREELTEITIPRDEEETKEETAAATEPQEPIVITEMQELELDDYKKLCTKLKAVAAESQRSMVTVTAASSDVDWFNEPYESKQMVSGLIVGNNGVELLVLTSYSEVKAADAMHVMFADKATADAAIKNYDSVTDLAVISINLAEIEQETLDYIQMAELGNSGSLRSGEPVIAVGSPAGTAGSVVYGNLVSDPYTVSVIDGEYDLLLTDMRKSAKSSGVLLNLDGKVIGLIQNKYSNSNNNDALTAYGISDMKSIIEHLFNNQDLVYIGITGANVTEQIAEAEGLPQGVYVSGVEMDSPAMNAGLQSGDIITEISGQKITGVAELQELLLKFSKDQEIQICVMRKGREGYKEIPCSVVLDILE